MTASEQHLDEPDDPQRDSSSHLDRRRALQWMGRLSLAGFLAACGVRNDLGTSAASSTTTAGSIAKATTTSDDAASSTSASTNAEGDGRSETPDTPPLTKEMFTALAVCTTLPATAAGPFPLEEQLRRRDITEDYPGHPLRLGIRVVDEACDPVSNAEVEIWHADAGGDYSAFIDNGGGKDEGAGTTFLRGTQPSNDEGIVEFQTIYPGWYPGRTVHIHVRVYLDGDRLVTSQLYFDEGYTAQIHATGEYSQFGLPDTSNSRDILAGDPNIDGSGITLTQAGTSKGLGTVGLINLGIAT